MMLSEFLSKFRFIGFISIVEGHGAERKELIKELPIFSTCDRSTAPYGERKVCSLCLAGGRLEITIGERINGERENEYRHIESVTVDTESDLFVTTYKNGTSLVCGGGKVPCDVKAFLIEGYSSTSFINETTTRYNY